MASLGPYLREHRERRGLSLEEMARATRVACRYLEAIETEEFRLLPAPVFTKGFIRAYCQTLGVDAEEALARYHEQTGEPVVAAAAPAPPGHERPAEARNRGAVLVSFVLLVVLGAALFAVTLALQSGRDDRRVLQASETPPAPAVAPAQTVRHEITTPATPGTPAPIAGAPAASAQPAPATPSRPAAAPSAAPPTASLEGRPAPDRIAAAVGAVSSPYRLVARVSEATWIRVLMQDGRSTEETIPAGEVREWVSNAPFVLTVGNAGGVVLELNGRPLPPLGARGAVVFRIVIPPAQQ